MAFLFKLEDEAGEPVEPHTFKTAVPNWKAGDTIPLPHRALRVVAVRDNDADRAPTLVVEDVP
jgi:hypothetical protein